MNARSVLAILVVAFASSAAVFAQAPEIDACALLTPEEVATALGMRGFDAAKKSFGPITSTPVGGLGEDAYYSTMAKPDTTTLRVKKGSTAFTVRVFGGGISADDVKNDEKAVAQAALAKL